MYSYPNLFTTRGICMKKILMASLIAASALTQAKADIVLSAKISPQYKKLLQRDMVALDNLKFQPADEETLMLMDLPALNSQTAKEWLEKRVSYVIEEDALTVLKLLFKKTIFEDRKESNFPNASILPYGMDPANAAPAKKSKKEEEPKAVTVMANIGAALYYGGKTEGKVYGMKISRGFLKKAIKVPVESPRTGIIQVGEGLFLDRLSINRTNPNALSNSINRLATFFHEARHSDGNGSSLSFFHASCPAGHDYAGVAACDENLNGPYTVGAVMTAEMLKACEENCSPTEKEILKMLVLDSQNRIMKITRKGTRATVWDARAESL